MPSSMLGISFFEYTTTSSPWFSYGIQQFFDSSIIMKPSLQTFMFTKDMLLLHWFTLRPHILVLPIFNPSMANSCYSSCNRFYWSNIKLQAMVIQANSIKDIILQHQTRTHYLALSFLSLFSWGWIPAIESWNLVFLWECLPAFQFVLSHLCLTALGTTNIKYQGLGVIGIAQIP